MMEDTMNGNGEQVEHGLTLLDLNGENERQRKLAQARETLHAVWLYDEDEGARKKIDDDERYHMYGSKAMRVDNALFMYGKDYAAVAAPDYAELPLELCEKTIAAMPEEKRKVYQEAYDKLYTSGNDTKNDWYALYGQMVRDGVREGIEREKGIIKERKELSGAVFANVVRNGGAVRRYDDGEVSSNQGAAWSRFYDGKARGVYTDADEVSLRRAAAAYEQFAPMIRNYTEAGANVLTHASEGKIIYDLLGDDEVAQTMFFAAVNDAAKDAAMNEAQKNAFVRFGREFAAADKNMMAAIMGGHFKPYVSDEDVDRYNDEISRIKEDTGGNGFSIMPGGMMASRYAAYGREDVRAKIAQTAKASGQLNEDGSIRKMTDEERRNTQMLNQFRSQLKQAVDGMYDVDGSFWGNSLGALGRMAPQSMLFLVPYVGQVGAFKASYTDALAGDLADGRSYDEASARAGASALINTAVEKIAFGSIGKAFKPMGLDRLMRTKVMGRMLGGVYGNTAGRFAMNVGVGVLEETYMEPFAGMVLSSAYNVIAPSEYELDNPWAGFRDEVNEMTKPENLMATALYGMLLGGVSVQGQRQEAMEYRETLNALVKAGADEGRAAQIARIEDPLERNREAVKEVGFNLATMDRQQAKGLVETLSDSYPLMAQMSTFGHYYESGRLPRLEEVEADAKGQKQYRVTENGREGEATVMSEEVARKYVQSRMEDMVEEEHARLADKFLADAMVTAAAERVDQFVVEEVGETMNTDYFERMATAAQVRLDAGRTRDEVVPEVHPELTLGELVEQSAAWQERLLIARHDAEQKLGRKLSDEEWEERKARLASPVNRTRLRAEQTAGRRMRTLLRVARGKYSAMNVLEDVTEDNVVRYMESTGQDLGFFVDNLRELGKAMGNEWQFLRELGEGEQHGMMDVVEGLGKVVRGKVLADTAHKANGLPAWVNTFLDMVRRWVEQAAALMQLGEAVNKYMYADETTREKFAPEFREMVEKVTEQDVEFLRELQQERSKEAEERILRAGATGYAPAAEATPTMDAAEAEHGEAVRQEQEAEEAYRERVDEDVSAALEMTSATNEEGAEEKTLQQQKGELHYVRHGDFESATVTRDPRAEDGSVEARGATRPGEADSSRDSDSGATQGAGRGVQRVHGELGDSLLAENNDRAEDGLQGVEERSRVRRNVHLTCKKHRFHADAAQKAREKNIYAGELHELQRGAESAALFRECIEAAKSSQGLQGNCVYTYSEDEYAQMRLFLTPDCKAGIALKDDGDMVSVFKDKTLQDRGERRIDALIALAIQQGAKKADCYGHFLVELYGRFGFRAVAKDRFNAEYAPEPMQDEGVMSEAFNKEPEVGKPDVVYLVYVGNRESVLDEFDSRYAPDYAETLDYAQGENTYDACVEMQSEAVKQAEKWMRTLPSKEARETALRKHLQRQSGGFTSAVEDETRNLAAVHSLSAEALLNLDKAGGIPKPSIAVTRLDKPYSWGGERNIYLVGEAGLADPQNGNLVYDRDAWTGKGGLDINEDGEFYTYNSVGDLRILSADEAAQRLVKKKGEESGAGLRGMNALPISTMEAVKAHRDMLADTETSREQKERTDEKIEALIDKVMERTKTPYSREWVEEELAKVCWRSSPLNDGAPSERKTSKEQARFFLNNTLNIRQKDIKADIVNLFVDATSALREEMEDYLESVPQRAVKMNEWKYAIVPENLAQNPDVMDVLNKNGIKAVVYDGSAEGRKAAFAGLVGNSDVSFAVEDERWAIGKKIQQSDAKDMAEREKLYEEHKNAGTLLLAPNGNKSNLDVGEWIFVRTSAFKAVFGDWEKAPTKGMPLDENGEPDLKAPNGQASELPPIEWCVVRTPEFKAWFGDWEKNPTKDMALDKNGEPLIVYHGSPVKSYRYEDKMPFTVFKDGNWNGLKFFFEDSDDAYQFGTKKAFDLGISESAYLYECYIKANKTLDIDNKEDVAKVIAAMGGKVPVMNYYTSEVSYMTQEEAQNMLSSGESWTLTETKEFVEEARKQGYDAIRARDGGRKYWAVFDSTQIKSVDNRGTFDGGNPDITFSAEEMWDEESLIMDENLRQNIELAQGRKMKAKTHVRLSSCPPVLKMLGEKDADVVTEARILWKIANTHKMSAEETERALRGMEYPMFVIKDSTSSYIFVPGVLATNNRQTLADVEVPLSLERTKDGKHYVMSAYALDSLDKIEAILNGGGKLVYSRYGKAALSTNGVQGVTPDFIRLMVERGFTSDTIIETEDVKSDFSSAMAYIDEEQITRPLKAAARSFRANEAFVQQMLGEMRQCMNKLRRLSDRTRTDREEALATMGAVVQLVKSVRLYMPRGYRFSVAPYIRQLEGLSELATTGRIHLTQKITEADIKRDAREVRLNGEAANSALETGAYEAEAMADELAREYGDQTLNAVLEEVMSRVADGLREYAKDEVVKRMAKLLERAQVKKDKKTGKLKGGLMDAEGYREMDKVREAVQMDAGALADKLASLEAKAAKDDLTDAQRDELEGDMALYSTFGDVASMSLEQATEAYEALRGRIMFNKFAWDDKRADIRHARRGVINTVVRALGKAKPNEYHRAKVNKKPTAKAKHMGDLMANAPQTLRALAKVPGLGAMAENIEVRMNKAGEMMKTWERERWVRLEALSRHCLGKSWRKCMDELHKQQGTGVAYERKIWRSVSIRSDYLKELLRMSPAERAEEMKRNRAAGGVLADAVYSERDIEALAEEMAAQRDGGRVRKTIETRYVEEVQREENLELSKGEALYIILMHEQPTYTERMEAQGYTREVIAGLRKYVGQGWLDFGYGLREMFAEQGDKIAAVYEEVYGVPFPREENYFAARFVVDKVSDNTAEGLLAGMTGQPGVGTGWMKPRVTHNLDVDTNKDALQVFLQAVSLTDSWVATQDIVADLKAYMGDKEFSRAVTAKLGKETYQNLKDWVKILEMGGVNDTVSMGAGQDMIRRVYSAGAISILGWRIQTWFRQFPAIANGVLGAHDVSVGEYLGAMSKLKHGTARMTFSRMLASDFMQNRYATDGDKMKEQAMRGEEQSSRMEGWLDAAMAPMGKIDAGLTAAGLVPVWNVYYERAMRQGCSEAEAEARAWEQTELAANMGSQPMGFLNKAKISQVRNPLARGVLFMLSENTNKVGLVYALWRSGHRKAAARAWLIYGGLNALISCLLDALQGDPEEFEKGKWWEYVLSAVYGPLASMPGVSEIVEGLGTAALNGVGYLVGSEELQKAQTRASIGRALIDFKGSYKAVKKLYELFSDDDEHSFYEYTRAASTISRMAGTGLGWMGNAAGYFSMLSSTLINPLDFGARAWRNAMHYIEG